MAKSDLDIPEGFVSVNREESDIPEGFVPVGQPKVPSPLERVAIPREGERPGVYGIAMPKQLDDLFSGRESLDNILPLEVSNELGTIVSMSDNPKEVKDNIESAILYSIEMDMPLEQTSSLLTELNMMNVREKGSSARKRIGERYQAGKAGIQLSDLGYQISTKTWSNSELFDKSLKDIKQLESMMAPDARRQWRGFWEKNFQATAEQLPQIIDTMKAGGEVAMYGGLVGGISAALAGTAIPSIGEEPALIAAGAKLGMKVGGGYAAAERIYELETGNKFIELMQMKDEKGNRIDPRLAVIASHAVGAINGGIEVAEWVTALKAFGIGEDVFKKAAQATTKKLFKNGTIKGIVALTMARYGYTLTAETGQEVLQETTGQVFGELAKEINDRMKGTDFKPVTAEELKQVYGQTIEQSLRSFGVILAPGITLNSAIQGLEVRNAIKDDIERKRPIRIYRRKLGGITVERQTTKELPEGKPYETQFAPGVFEKLTNKPIKKDVEITGTGEEVAVEKAPTEAIPALVSPVEAITAPEALITPEVLVEAAEKKTIQSGDYVRLTVKHEQTDLGIRTPYLLPEGQYRLRVEEKMSKKGRPSVILHPVDETGNPIKLKNVAGQENDSIVLDKRRLADLGPEFQVESDLAPAEAVKGEVALIEEAKKYKTAEEFVAAIKVNPEKIPTTPEYQQYLKEQDTFVKREEEIYAELKSMREKYSGKTINEVPKSEITKYDNLQKELDKTLSKKTLAKSPEGVIKTHIGDKGLEAQLTDIWNKAQQAPTEAGGGVTEAEVKVAEEPGTKTLEIEKDIQEPELPSILSSRNADIDEQRKRLGLDVIASPTRKADQQVKAEALKQDIPAKALRIASDIVAGREAPLTDVEEAGMTMKLLRLGEEMNPILRKLATTNDTQEIQTLRGDMAHAKAEYDTISEALHKGITEVARALRFRQVMIKLEQGNYSLLYSQAKMKAEKGKALTAAENTKLEELTRKLSDSDEQIKKLQTQIDDMTARQAIRERGAKKYSRMSLEQKDTQLRKNSERIRELIEQGCY